MGSRSAPYIFIWKKTAGVVQKRTTTQQQQQPKNLSWNLRFWLTMTATWRMLGSGGGYCLLNACWVPDAALDTAWPFSPWTLRTALGSMCYYPHFPDEETEAQGDEGGRSRSQNWSKAASVLPCGLIAMVISLLSMGSPEVGNLKGKTCFLFSGCKAGSCAPFWP